ncbi:MAG: hypothetical protein WC293_06500 [Candidatus Omnitrophota bacterium]|jgi:acetylornithine deacetylase/succinyl-diaminopimelate desuccinylase-like protein
MKELIKAKAKGLKKDIADFYNKTESSKPDSFDIGRFSELIIAKMKELSFDKVVKDGSGNLIGVIKGYSNKDAILVVSHIDTKSLNQQKLEGFHSGEIVGFKSGVISSIYTGALIKRTLLPLTGDLIICCVPRTEYGGSGIQYLFDNFLKDKVKKIKGVILCEPTGFNVNLGHKGRMEYEIVVKGRLNRNFLENRGINMLGTMFPLISELEKVSKELPNDLALGRSNLRIKDVRYSGYQPQDTINEFRVVVDRVFIPEESEGYILDKAKAIAKTVYKQEPDITINTLLAKERVKTYTGFEMVSEKEFKPWAMEGHAPFALESLKALTESGFKSNFGYWKKIVTEGSYTYAKMKIPTIGFGAGLEDTSNVENGVLTVGKVERAVYGQGLMVLRNIGVPTFGWSSDEI